MLAKEEEKNLFCFSMSKSAKVDLQLGEFAVVAGFKLLSLEEWSRLDFEIPLTDPEGRSTTAYIKI